MVTPLPPERTGIADYVAVLLPSLAQHFDIDLYTTADPALLGDLARDFTVRHWEELAAHRPHYDQVVYQFGNSPFHSHMVEMLDAMPGVVVLHDFYLSSMFDYMERVDGKAALFRAELERSHGEEATRLLDREGAAEALKRYPASLRIIERATAVIVHSEHSAQLRAQFYPDFPATAWYRVPMPQAPSASLPADQRQAIRTRRGVSAKDFLLISLGFVADTKLNHSLLEALADPRLSGDAYLRVVFVGENDPLEYGQSLVRGIESLPGSNRIAITGFVDAATYEDYLQAADCAVQLRTRSRGETSKAAHDCMSHGLATVVNDYAALGELPDECVSKVGAEAGAPELADALWRLRSNPLQRAVTGMMAKHHMTTHHLSHLVAARYAEVIEASLHGPAAGGAIR